MIMNEAPFRFEKNLYFESAVKVIIIGKREIIAAVIFFLQF